MKRKQDMILARVEDEMTKLKKAMEQCAAPPGTALDQQNKKDEGCALLQTDVQIGHDQNVQHTGFTSDSEGPTRTDDDFTQQGTYTELKADAQSYVRGEGGSHDSIHRCPN
ncbi:hypothetical protein M0R45_015618 [Rubus argutus]|uniref:Uncharacterized protein n=1 Tax=Rubus argutus TaxID=59490 RepID=A0AAW1XQ49_RUBAR